MQFTVAALGFAAIASASYHHPPAVHAPVYENKNASTTVAPSYTTEVVTAYETYCPGPTAIEHNGVTYTVTEATTLTITNCPCTLTKPVYSSTSVPVPSVPVPEVTPVSPVSPPKEIPPPPPKEGPPAPPKEGPPAPPKEGPPAPAPPMYPGKNETTVPGYNPPPTGVVPPPASTVPIAPAYTGAASKTSFGVAAVLAGAGLIAAL